MHTILVLCIIILLFTIHPASKRKCSINNNQNIFQRSLNTYDVHEREYQKIKHSIKYNFLLALFCCPSFQRLALFEVRFHITARFPLLWAFYFYKHSIINTHYFWRSMNNFRINFLFASHPNTFNVVRGVITFNRR